MPTVTNIYPTSDGAKGLSRYPVAARNYTAIDDTTPDDDTEFVYYNDQFGVGMEASDSYGLPNRSDIGIVTSITIEYRVRNEAGTCSGWSFLNIGGQTLLSTLQNLSTGSWQTFTATFRATGSNWDNTAWNAAQIGVGLYTDGNDTTGVPGAVRATRCYVKSMTYNQAVKQMTLTSGNKMTLTSGTKLSITGLG